MKIESFQPISVKSPVDNWLLFFLRCVVDLQLATIARFLKPALSAFPQGRVLDIGAGQSPWKGWLPSHCIYTGLDVGYADQFAMSNKQGDVIFYDGLVMPFEDCCFNSAFCIEVLEHSQTPELLMAEAARVLKDDGVFVLTVPWSARRHHIPFDFHRFTRERLRQLFENSDFEDIRIVERGSDISVIANKLIILSLRLLFPKVRWHFILTLPFALLVGLMSLPMLVVAHICIFFNLGLKEDPLGYFVLAKRKSRAN
jgi:SAM-dependent methyltransferase